MQDIQQTFNSNQKSTFVDKIHDKINQTESNTDSLQDQLSLDRKTNPTENTKRKSLQTQGLFNSDILIEPIYEPPLELRTYFSDVSSVEKPQVEKQCSKLKQQKTIETNNQGIWKHDWHAIKC